MALAAETRFLPMYYQHQPLHHQQQQPLHHQQLQQHHHHQQQQQQQQQHYTQLQPQQQQYATRRGRPSRNATTVAAAAAAAAATVAQWQQQQQQQSAATNQVVAPPEKDFSVPLHVDCSVEYELPECAKPPQGVKVEPLLMIHPAHFRRLDSLRRCPFVNNLPAASVGGNASHHHHHHNDAVLPFDMLPQELIAARPSCRRTVEAAAAAASIPDGAACCRTSCPKRVSTDPYAPKEGDTLESFGKCANVRMRHYQLQQQQQQQQHYPQLQPQQHLQHHHQRQHHRSHPYDCAPLGVAATAIAATNDCDKTLDALQGNPLIASSPFHAKMFTDALYHQQQQQQQPHHTNSNYPIVMYK